MTTEAERKEELNPVGCSTIFHTPDSVKTVNDPHHGEICAWMHYDEDFWVKHGIAKRWTRVKRIHPTKQRIQRLNELFT